MVYLSGIKLEYISQIQEVGVILFFKKCYEGLKIVIFFQKMVYLFYILSIFNPLKSLGNKSTAYSQVRNKRPPATKCLITQ